MTKQKTIQEKWKDGGITILPPKKDAKKKVAKKAPKRAKK